MKKCGKCGKRTQDGAKFCPNCGESMPRMEKRDGVEAKIDEPTLHIETEFREGPPKTAIIKMVGTVEAKDARLLRSILHELGEKQAKKIILDLENVLYMSSAALGLLVSYATEKKQETGSLCVYLAGVSQAVGGAISVLGLVPFFAIFPNLDSALDSLKL